MNPVLYGKDTTENIVAIENERGNITVVTKDGKKTKYPDFRPFIMTKNPYLLDRINNAKGTKFEGEGYNFVIKMPEKEYWSITKMLREQREDYFTVTDIPEQFMVETGKTLFKGMEFKDIKRMQWNIESTGLSLTDSKILIICWKCGEEHGEIHGEEEQIISTFVNVINEQDPDVIETYNGFSYDWQLLANRAGIHNVLLDIGRKACKSLYFYRTFIRIGDNQVVEIQMPKVWGRHVVDLYYSVRAWDVIYRELESYKLDEVTQRFGLKLDDMDFNKENMAEVWKTQKDMVIRHCSNDCLAIEHISNQLTQKDFYQTQMLPLSYEKVCVASSGAKMTGIFLREYYRNKCSIPSKQEKTEFQGALVGAKDRGIFENVYHVDVNSLYPNVMLRYNICPKSDTLKLFPQVLKSLTDIRFDLKERAKQTGKERYKASEQAHKILINSLYGLLGSNFFNWNDMSEAARVTETGRKILTDMERIIEEDCKCKVLEMDTDGIYLTSGAKIDEEQFLEQLNAKLPDGIDCDIEYYKFFCNMLPKNYIRVTEDGTMKMSGVSFRSRAIEKFGKEFIRESIWDILNKKIWRIRKRYLLLRNKIINRQLEIDEFVQHREINRSTDNYSINKKKTDQVYEALIEKGKEVAIGNKLSYYMAENNGKKCICKFKEDYNDDYDIEYMMDRLEAFTNRLKPLINEDIFSKLFSPPKASINKADYKYKEVCHTYIINGEKKWSKWERLESTKLLGYIKKNAGSEVYYSVQKFRFANKVYGEDFLMPLFFDLDVEQGDNIQVALLDANHVLDSLYALDIPKQMISVSFSGNKGFHIIINEEVFGFKPSRDLHMRVAHLQKHFEKTLKLQTLCHATGNRKMLRIQNTINLKSGLYKITIPHKLILERDVCEILKLAQTPKKKEKTIKPELIPKAQKCYQDCMKDYIVPKITKTEIKKIDFTPVCIKHLLEDNLQVKGMRNKATLVLAEFYKDYGFSEKETTSVIENWTKKIPQEMTSSRNGARLGSMLSCIKSVYSSNIYHFNCSFIKSLGWKINCSSRCKFCNNKEGGK
jgi:DNA polymerase elongation subunit (family B)